MKRIRLVLFLTCGLLFSVIADAAEQEKLTGSGDGLVAALRSSITLHPSIKAKQEELSSLGFDLDSAKSRRYPTVGAQANTTSNVEGASVKTSSGELYNSMMVVAKQPLWAGGRIDGGIEQATVKQKIGAFSLLEIQRQLMESTAATYALVLGDRTRFEAARLNVHEHERLKETITRREAGGIASQADMELAASRLTQAVTQKIQLESTLLKSQNDLLGLTLQPVPTIDQVPVQRTELPPAEQILADIEKVSATMQLRLAEVELARTSANLAAADMMPSLYAKVEHDLLTTSNSSANLPEGTRVGVVLEGSLEGLGFSGVNKVQSAESRVRAAQKNVEGARNDIRTKVQGLLTDLRSQQAMLHSSETLVHSTEKTLESFLRQFDAGRKTWVDVLNTQREFSEERLNLEQIRSALLATKLRLAAQCGKLDQVAGVTIP